MAPGTVIDILELYEKQFGGRPYVVPGLSVTQVDSTAGGGFKIQTNTQAEKEFTKLGSTLREKYRGIEILLPIRFFEDKTELMYLPYCVLRISGKKTIIETSLSERIGSVKEQFNIDDYVIDIKGFLISENRKFPESEIDQLRTLYEKSQAVVIDNALTNIFLTRKEIKDDSQQRRVVIYSFDLPEQQGGREHVRPFTMNLKSDTVFTLEVE